MKRIAVFCDGTWNRSDSQTPTNVVRLAAAMAPLGPDGVVQVPIYIQGVGTGQGVTRLSRWADKVLGGAFGWGLMANIVEAYRHLVFLYEPGDEIFIFGFSRGAYTARSLAGFIRCTGIVDRDRLHKIPEAVERYRRKGDPTTHPSTPESFDFRSNASLRVVTSAAEAAHRRDAGMPEAPLLRLAYLGVWDTVGALGVPKHLALAPVLNRDKFRFHDADLTRLVRMARHAIALDERRPSFCPTQWENLERLNGGPMTDDAPYQERFFAGDHGSVGGGGDILDLSSITLRWIAEGAAEAGLALDPKALAAIARKENPMGPLHNHSERRQSLVERIMRMRLEDREGPERMEELHPAVYQRWSKEAKATGFKPYRPGSLKRVETQLAAFHAAQSTAEEGTRFA